MSLHTKNHNIKLKNLKTHFNRERGNHNIEFNKHNILFSSIIFSLVGITILSGFLLSRPKGQLTVSAAEGSTLASVVVPDVCSLASSSTNHTGTVNGGTYTENFGGESTVTVTCNDRNGYSVYAVGYSNDIEGTNGLIGTSTGLVIPSGTSTSTNVSNWAMKLTPGTGTYAPTILSDTNGSFANYHVVPTTATKVATLTSDINVSNSSQFKTSYAVAVAPTQAADTYIGKVKYTVVHPNYSNADGTLETYNIPVTFAGTGVSSVTFEAAGYPTRTVSTSGSTANLTAGIEYTVTASFTSEYEFVSWALNNATYGTLGSTSANPTTFTPNANSASAVITTTGQKQKTYMQNLTSSIIATLLPSVGSTATVYDNRDENEYTIAKLADNKYWMVSNLNLAGGTAISCTTSDCENYTIPTTQGWQSGGKLPASSTSGFNTDNYAYVYNSGSTTCGDDSPCYSYYSWDAATLGSGRNISTDNTNAPYSICPKGWKLPTTYNGSGTAAAATDFRKLMIALGGSNSVQTYSSSTTPTGATMYGKLTASPYSFLIAGYCDNGSFGYGGSFGGYWSATSYSSSTYARALSFGSTYVHSAGNYLRRLGFSVRCVFGS